jgi:hypothetical protein
MMQSDLPGQRRSNESVKKTRVGDGRRIVAADKVKHEVQRRNGQHTPDCRNPECSLGKFHWALLNRW